MPFLFLLIYQCIYLLRPFEWGNTPTTEDPGGFPFAITAMLMSLGLFLMSKKPKHLSPQFWLGVALIPIILLSAAANLWIGAGIVRSQIFILVAVLPIYLYSNIIDTNNKQETLMFVFLVSALIMLSHGMSQQLAEDGIGWAGTAISLNDRITFLGVLEDPNDLAGFFVMCLPFAGFFSTYGKSFWIRLFGKACGFSMLYGIYLTNSRGALLATLVTIGSYILYRYGKGKTFLLGILSLPALAFVVSSFRSIDSTEESASDRIDAWFTGLELLTQNPVFGIGSGNFIDYSNITAHNSFILIMAELGIIGYVLWFCIVSLSFYMLFTALKHYQQYQQSNNFKRDINDDSELTRALAIGTTLFFSILGYATTAFFLSRSYQFLTYFMCAIAIASYLQITRLKPEYKFTSMSSQIKKMSLLSLVSILGMKIIVKLFV